jgi:hypothetical protein
MAFTIPTAKALAAQFLAAIEARLNQTTPPVARAFNRTLSAALAMFGAGVYKFTADRSIQSLALTATGEDLDKIGSNYGVTRKPAIAAILELELVATNGTVIPEGTVFSSASNGETYTTIAEVTAAVMDLAILNVVASTPGDGGNLNNTEILDIGAPIVGAASTAEVTDTLTYGAAAESDSDYRRRVLTRIRAEGGGGNAADYREWGEEVEDAARVFPYSGKPITFTATELFEVDGSDPYTITYDGADPSFSFLDMGLTDECVIIISGCSVGANNISTEILNVTDMVITVAGPLTTLTPSESFTITNESLPGDRTVYVESEASPDVCPPATLADVREHLLTDPETGLSRMPVGLTDDRLYVESIYRTLITVYVVGLDVAADVLAEVEAKIETAITDYVARVCCFVGGLDYPGDRVDTVSKGSLGTVVQGVIRGYGGSIEYVTFEIDSVEMDVYQLSQGELLGLVGGTPIVFVDSYPPGP